MPSQLTTKISGGPGTMRLEKTMRSPRGVSLGCPAAAFAQDHPLALAIVGIEAHQDELIASGVRIGAVALHPHDARMRARQRAHFGARSRRRPRAAGAAGRQQAQRRDDAVLPSAT